MAYCDKCGAGISPTANFCRSCGAKIEGTKLEESKVASSKSPMKTVAHGAHVIQIAEAADLFGKEEVYYDGRLVSSKRTMTGGTHIFSTVEDGERVDYDVQVEGRWHGLGFSSTVRRNGIIVYTDK